MTAVFPVYFHSEQHLVVLFAEKKLTDEEIQELLFGDSDLDVDSDTGDEAKKFEQESVFHEENCDDVCSEHENDEKETPEKGSLLERSQKKKKSRTVLDGTAIYGSN